MKKLFLLAVATLIMGTTAKAQIGESKSKKIETTYTTTTRTVEVLPNKNYNRIFFGFANTKFSMDGESESAPGFDLGWTKGINVTKGKRLPLYIETGLAMNMFIGDVISEKDKLLNFEIPVNITYRWNIPGTKILASPYFGFHFKINALWKDDDSNNYFDIDGTKRFQFGCGLGANFDIKHFYFGIGGDFDFMPIAKFETRYDDYSMKTIGVRVNIGVTW